MTAAIREALLDAYGALDVFEACAVRDSALAELDALVAERDEYQEEVFRLASLNDGLVAERDRLAAQLAAAERERDEALHAEDVAERYREAAEARVADMRRQRDDLDESRRLALVAEQDQRARVAALEGALRKIIGRIEDHTEAVADLEPGDPACAAYDIARAALAAADRPVQDGPLDTSYRERRVERRMADPEYRQAYQQATRDGQTDG